MKLEQNTSQHTTTITKAADFGINENDLSHIMGILRSQIYSDKLMAVIREYSTNATDANIEAGRPDTPICVHLPTIADPYIGFRDFGVGLSEDDVTQLYVKYGASTKRNSNDYTGCLGIGCKAGFAYGDNFQVITHHGRYSKTWLARIDETKRGTISLVHTTNHHTPVNTGTEVRVSIRKNDIESCINKAKQLFTYWRVQPTCNLELDKPKYHAESDDWAILDLREQSYDRRAYYNSAVIMGNIVYPINPRMIKTSDLPASLLDSSAVLLRAPVGSLDIAANRESLEYTDRTCDSIIAMCNNMIADLILNVTNAVTKAPTRLKASMNAHIYSHCFNYNISSKLVTSAKWQGQPLLDVVGFPEHGVCKHSKHKSWRASGDDVWRNKRDKDIRNMKIDANSYLCVFNDNQYNDANATRRVRTLQLQNNDDPNHSYYVIPMSKLDQITPTLTSDDYIDLDKVEPLKPNRTTITTNNGTKSKSVRINVCKLQPNTLKSSRLSAECEPTIDPTHKVYVYVPLDRFDWVGKPDALEELDAIYDALHTMLGYRPTINGVKKHYIKKLDDQWMTLDAFYLKVFTDYRKSIPHVEDILLATSACHHYHWSHDMLSLLEQCDNPTVSKVAKILLIRDTNVHHDIKKICKVGYLLHAIKRTDWLKDQWSIITNKYKLLSGINYLSYPISDTTEQDFINDINKLLA